MLEWGIEAVGERAYTTEAFVEDQKRGSLLSQHRLPPIEQDPLPALDAPGKPLPPARIFSAAFCGFLEEPFDEAPENLLGRSRYYAQVILGSLDAAEALRCWRYQ